MLTNNTSGPCRPGASGLSTPQRGVVLFVALVVLVAMTLAGVALIRSISSGNRVAGNLAFQQAATQSADVGVETAIAWLESNNTGTTLYDYTLDPTTGYFPARGTDPVAGTSWESYWNTVAIGSGRYRTMPTDAAGNTVAYVIHRLCNGTGAPSSGSAACAAAPAAVGPGGGSMGSGVPPISIPTQQYYRITARVSGPRNTVSFVQVVVAM